MVTKFATNIRCDVCGSRDVMAIKPGSDPLRATDIRTKRDRTIARGTPSGFWCLACWPYLARQRTQAEGRPT